MRWLTLKVLTTKTDDLTSIPRTHIVERELKTTSRFDLHMCVIVNTHTFSHSLVHSHTHAGTHTHTHTQTHSDTLKHTHTLIHKYTLTYTQTHTHTQM